MTNEQKYFREQEFKRNNLTYIELVSPLVNVLVLPNTARLDFNLKAYDQRNDPREYEHQFRLINTFYADYFRVNKENAPACLTAALDRLFADLGFHGIIRYDRNPHLYADELFVIHHRDGISITFRNEQKIGFTNVKGIKF